MKEKSCHSSLLAEKILSHSGTDRPKSTTHPLDILPSISIQNKP